MNNVHLLRFDVARLEEIFAPGEVSRFFINFCDPWPKKRHAKRRLTYRDFLDRYARLLAEGGRIDFKSDNAGLFDFTLEEFKAVSYTHLHLYQLRNEQDADDRAAHHDAVDDRLQAHVAQVILAEEDHHLVVRIHGGNRE